ncbi:MAG: phosphate ABC transporter substrate-binding protein PstS [Actinomycetota bacterium]
MSPSVTPSTANHTGANRRRFRATARITSAAAMVGLIASACSSGTSDTTLHGAGASTQAPITTSWQAPYETYAGGQFQYDVVGSGTGVEQFLAGDIDFAGTDDYLSEEERRIAESTCPGPFGAVNVPTYLSSIGLIYNLPSLEGEQLNLSADVIAAIFAGDITNWNDPAIARDNPDVELPDLAIVPVHRFDSSGTTENFTEYLSAAAPDAWTYGEFSNWTESGPAGESAVYSGGTAQVVGAAEGSIGYVDVTQAGGLPVAAIEAGDGFVLPTDESVTEAYGLATPAYPNEALDFAVDFDRTPESDTAYPLAMLSYTVVCLQYDDLDTANAVSSYLYFVQTDEAQEIASAVAGAVPLDVETTERIGAVSESIGTVTPASAPELIA